jgi:hypothetical protein
MMLDMVFVVVYSYRNSLGLASLFGECAFVRASRGVDLWRASAGAVAIRAKGRLIDPAKVSLLVFVSAHTRHIHLSRGSWAKSARLFDYSATRLRCTGSYPASALKAFWVDDYAAMAAVFLAGAI